MEVGIMFQAMYKSLILTIRSDKVRWDGRLSSKTLPLVRVSKSQSIIIEFHAVWDGLIIAKAVRTVPRNYTAPLPNVHVESTLRGDIYDPFIRQIVWEGLLGAWADDIFSWARCPSAPLTTSNPVQHHLGIPPTDDDTVCPYFWAKPIHSLNCEIVWPPAMDADNHPPIELDTPEYAGRIEKEMLVGKLLAMGGIRTAAVLNTIFGDPEESGKLVNLNSNGIWNSL